MAVSFHYKTSVALKKAKAESPVGVISKKEKITLNCLLAKNTQKSSLRQGH